MVRPNPTAWQWNNICGPRTVTSTPSAPVALATNSRMRRWPRASSPPGTASTRWADPYAWLPRRTRHQTLTRRRRFPLRRRDGTRDLSRLHRSLFRLCAGVRALRGRLYRHDRDGKLRSYVPRLLGNLLGLLRLSEPWIATRGRGLRGLCPRVRPLCCRM
jgi:hypothetical protein